MSAIVIHPVEVKEPIEVSAPVFTRASTATYLDAAGQLVTAANNVRRPLFVEGVQTGWILEPAATNLLSYSEQFDNAAWIKVNCTITPNATPGPDGYTSADRLVEAAGVGNHFLQRNISLSAGSHTLSVWGKPSGSRTLNIQVENPAGTYKAAAINLTTGQVVTNSGVVVFVAPAANGFLRCAITFTAAAGAASVYLLAADLAGNQITTGDGSSGFYLYGADLKAGGVSSYILTAAASATRAAESYTPGVYTPTGHDLISTTAVETYAEWAPAASYAIGNIVMSRRVGRIFMNLVAGVDATRPESAPTRWEDIGPTNAMAMFDKEVGSVTTATNGITVVLQPGAVSGMALQELRNATGVHVEMSATPGGPIEFERFISLESVEINSFYDWYFAPVEYRSDAQLVGLPRLATCEMRVTIFGNGAVGCGLLALGKVMELGQAQYGASIGIINKSVKTENKFGRVSVKKLGYARRMNYTVWTQRMDFNRILKFLADTKDDPCIFIVTDAEGLESLSAYGFYKDFNIEISYPTVNLCSLQVEGLV